MEEVMTDKQMFTMLKMILAILERCNTKEEAIEEIKSFLADNKKDQ
ncbi:MAG: hypothetical protein NC395_11360 [Prevotella sp.]|nr:hypothetical protein [Prevotella sp.]